MASISAATLTLRATKGSPLTNAEVDANFTSLNTQIALGQTAASYTASDVLAKLLTVDGAASGLDADTLDGLNSATANTVSTIVARDALGNFAAGTITANLTGNASTATNLADTLSVAKGGTGATSTAAARTNLGLVIGTDVQAQNANLSALAGLTSVANALPYFTGDAAATTTTLTATGRSLIAATTAATARSTLGLIIGTDVQPFAAILSVFAAAPVNTLVTTIDGNVGIGTDSPSTYGKFVVQADNSFTSSLVSTSSSTSSALTDKPTLEFRKTMNVTSGQTSALGRISFNGKFGSTAGEQAYLSVTSQNNLNLIDVTTLRIGIPSLSAGNEQAFLEMTSGGRVLLGTSSSGKLNFDSKIVTINANDYRFKNASNTTTLVTIDSAGELTATGNITAFFSDDRLKTRTGAIVNALDKLSTLDTFYYTANDIAQSLGYAAISDVGISAQQVQAVLPEVVVPAPIDNQYLTIRYEKLVPLLIAAINELNVKVDLLSKQQI